ncbi:MAG: hypothetical protein KC492_31170, partial [Myxococcales bacterium]|nr:hypothetical protein [Myxococcales bacterium]
MTRATSRLGRAAFGAGFCFLAASLPAVALAAEPQAAERAVPSDTATPSEAPEAARPSRWDFQGDVGVPRLESGETKLIGSGDVGYRGDDYRLSGHLGISNYAAATPGAYNATAKRSFGLGGTWSLVKPNATSSLELKGALDYTTYATVYIPTDVNSGELFSEFSGMTRGTLLLGGTKELTPSLLVALAGGAGLQSENYYASSDANVEASTSSTARYVAQADARWRMIAETLAVRAHSDVSYASVTRTQFAVDSLDANEPTTDSFALIESTNRLFAELEMFQFGGVVPSAFVGLDVFSLQGSAGSALAYIPSVGVGLSN